MPRANPESSFETAARHLFRHLNDWNSLRHNPLVRLLRVRTGSRQRSMLTGIHARILAATKTLCKDTAAAGSEIRARRQYAIVAALCAGETVARTSARLGLSRRQYYRERRAICMRLSRNLLPGGHDGATRFEVSDPLRLSVARAETLLDLGFAGRAAALLNETRTVLPDGAERRAVELQLADAFMALGLTDRAAELLRISYPSAAVNGSDDPTARWLEDLRALAETRLGIETTGDADVGREFELLARRQISSRQGNEEGLSFIVECGNWHCQNGRFARARGMLRHARDLSRQLSHVTAQRQIAVALLAAHCAEDSIDEFDLEHRWLREARALSISHGSVCGMLQSLNGLMNYHAGAGADDQVYALARETLRVARHTEGTRILADAGVEVATMILRTRYWRSVDPLLFEVERFTRAGTLRWAILKHLQGNFFMRTRRSGMAQAALSLAHEAARALRNRRLESIALRDLAIATYNVGSGSTGIELMRRAVELAEGHSGIWSLCKTYEAAAQILADRRLVRLARQFRAAISARAQSKPALSSLPPTTGRPHLSLGESVVQSAITPY